MSYRVAEFKRCKYSYFHGVDGEIDVGVQVADLKEGIAGRRVHQPFVVVVALNIFVGIALHRLGEGDGIRVSRWRTESR